MAVSQRSILSYLKELGSLQPEKPLLGNDAHWLSAGKVLSLVEHVATALRRMNISGTTVAVRCTRTLETAILLLSLRAAGAVAVLIDPREDVETALGQTDAEIPVQAVIAQTGQTVFRITRGETSAELDLFALPPSAGSLLHSNADEPAFVIFTSGSTGKSKAVVLTEGNLVNNLIDSQPLGDYQPDDRALGALPLHHVFGLVLLSGASVLGYSIFLPEKTDIASILCAIEAQRLTRMNGVPSLYLAMAEQCGGQPACGLHRRRTHYGGAVSAHRADAGHDADFRLRHVRVHRHCLFRRECAGASACQDGRGVLPHEYGENPPRGRHRSRLDGGRRNLRDRAGAHVGLLRASHAARGAAAHGRPWLP